jgi:hypothetical protein
VLVGAVAMLLPAQLVVTVSRGAVAGRLGWIIALIAGSVAGLLVYLIAQLLLRSPELRWSWTELRRTGPAPSDEAGS